ncbi:hypothetical protein GE09DRAFT_280573 [Coniochaeta sp. 2T2.1]|nr:hypothetical protein GE09DRAFT_280573 [Coniochaeta sp. 2T2.1]
MSFFDYKRDLSNLPETIRCDVGKEWRAPVYFSKTKLHQFANNLRRGSPRVTAARSGIACRIHSGEPDPTMKCNGPCGKMYALDAFSRNTRTAGKYWCNLCTDWQLTNEAGITPFPTPYMAHPGREKDENEDGATNQGEGTVIDDDTASVAYSAEPARSVVAESYISGVTFGGPTGSSAVPTAEGSVYSEATHRTTTGAQQFNAWAPNGVVHRLTKAQTVVSERSTATEHTVTPSGWVKPSQRKFPADAPAYLKYGTCDAMVGDDDYHSNDGLSDDEP